MTPTQIVSQIRTFGGCLILLGDKRVRVEPGPNGVPSQLIDQIRERKAEIIDELRQRERVLIQAQRLLRVGQWPPTAPVCAFFVGCAGGATCGRCGASWIEHLDGAPP